MPDSGRDAGRADEFYAVARSISNIDWNHFARGEAYLKLPNSIVDDITTDYRSALEQKFQMILKWEQREGRNATVVRLKELRDSFLGQGPAPAPPTDAAPPRPVSAPTPSQAISGERQAHMSFRHLLVKVANSFSNPQFVMAKNMYGPTGDTATNANAGLYFAALNDNGSWGLTIEEKLEYLEDMLDLVGADRQRFSVAIERVRSYSQRAFNPSDRQQQPANAGAGNLNAPDAAAQQLGSRQQQRLPHASSSQPAIAPSSEQGTVQRSASQPGLSQSGAAPLSSSQQGQHRAAYQGPSTARPANESTPFHPISQPSDVSGNESRQSQPGLTQTDGPSSITISSSTLQRTNINLARGNVNIHTTSAAQEQSDSQTDACDSRGDEDSEQDSRFFVEQSSAQRNPGGAVGHSSIDICVFEGTNVEVKRSSPECYRTQQSNSNEVYRVEHKPKGCAIIISNINFCWGEAYKRRGGKRDCELMENLFGENGLGLQTFVYEDQRMEAMWKSLDDFSKHERLRTADMCVVIIMSHGLHMPGEGDAILGTDGRPLQADHVIRIFDNDNCPYLRHKPKMFFFQFCRGQVADRGVLHETGNNVPYPDGRLPEISQSLQNMEPASGDETDSIEHLPRRSDVLVAFATQEGNLSFRSWFTNALANVFSQHAHEMHVCDMLKMVKRGLAQKVSWSPGSPRTHLCKEMADVRDILLKNVYFYPGFP